MLISECSLELNIRQLILSDLASSIGEAKAPVVQSDSVLSAIDLITSRVETRVSSDEEDDEQVDDERGKEEDTKEERVFMVCDLDLRFLSPHLNHPAQLKGPMQYWLRGISCQSTQHAC